MKKFLFVVAALASCMTVSAKYWFSGSIGFDGLTNYDSDFKNYSLEFSPSVGMEIEDNLSIAVNLSLRDSKYNGSQVTQFRFSPYLRWTFFEEGQFSMFLDGGFSYRIYSPAGYNYWELGVFANPGIRYDMSDHFAVAAMFRGLYFGHESRPDSNPGSTYKNSYGLAGNFTDLSFSLIYEF